MFALKPTKLRDACNCFATFLLQVTVSEDRLSTVGHKFYCTIRANHYVNRGSWYFEIKIVDLPEGAATRIGWAQRNANLQVSMK